MLVVKREEEDMEIDSQLESANNEDEGIWEVEGGSEDLEIEEKGADAGKFYNYFVFTLIMVSNFFFVIALL